MIEALELRLEDLKDWPNASFEGTRNAILAERVGSCLFLKEHVSAEEFLYGPTAREVEAIGAMARDACRAGRMIDFGRLPNAALMAGGNRGGPMWNRGALPQPFYDPWLLFHTWDGDPEHDKHNSGACYLVAPLERGVPNGAVEIVELQVLRIKGTAFLVIGDRATLVATEDDADGDPARRYHCFPVPSLWRFLPGAERVNGKLGPFHAVAGNVIDPLCTCLMILHTLNVPRETVPAPHKLNKHRIAKGKPPIPAYERVDAAPYVTALLPRGRGRGEALGGTHAAPIPHTRRAHLRTLPTGQMKLILETLVNVSAEVRSIFKEQQSQRSHYTVKGHPPL